MLGALGACNLPVLGGEDEGPNPGPPTGSVPDIPELTADERALAKQLINDPEAVPEGAASVPELAEVGRVSYEIESVGVWSTMKDLRKLGAVAEVVFSEPIVIDATLPVTIYDDEERSFPPYTTDIQHAVFVEVEDLLVLVDLEHEQVIRIVPGSGEYVGPGAGQPSNITTMMSCASISLVR